MFDLGDLNAEQRGALIALYVAAFGEADADASGLLAQLASGDA
jgi:hypothetical protein